MTAKKKMSELDIQNEVNRVPMTAENRANMSLNIYDLQYLIRLQELSNEAFMEEFNEKFCESVAVKVAKELGDTLAPIWKILSNLEDGQKRVEGLLKQLKNKVSSLEDRVEKLEKAVFK
ncbi:MAG: hypothetical protein QHH74_11905 [Spirochaetota bacterium]|nr:hypothetical protein [Spirochaetota bacterium]